jgi:hypothetical protein
MSARANNAASALNSLKALLGQEPPLPRRTPVRRGKRQLAYFPSTSRALQPLLRVTATLRPTTMYPRRPRTHLAARGLPTLRASWAGECMCPGRHGASGSWPRNRDRINAPAGLR